MLSECGRWSIAKVPVFPSGVRYELHRHEEPNGKAQYWRWVNTKASADECKAVAERWQA